jgi:hypothetical protein
MWLDKSELFKGCRLFTCCLMLPENPVQGVAQCKIRIG